MQHGHLDILNLLINKEADLTVKDAKNCTLLHLAVKSNQETVCRQLITERLDVNSQDVEGSSPLHLAVEFNFCPLVQLLLENNADINKNDLDDYTPLHTAAKIKNNFDALELLIKHNAKLDSPTVHGDLPLHVAAAVGNARAFAFLFSKKYMNYSNRSELTPLQIAQENGCLSIVHLISELDKNNNAPPRIPILTRLYTSKRRTIS